MRDTTINSKEVATTTVIFLGFDERSSISDLKKSPEVARHYNFKPSKDITLVYMKFLAPCGKIHNMFLGSMNHMLPKDITKTIYFLPGAFVIQEPKPPSKVTGTTQA